MCVLFLWTLIYRAIREACVIIVWPRWPWDTGAVFAVQVRDPGGLWSLKEARFAVDGLLNSSLKCKCMSCMSGVLLFIHAVCAGLAVAMMWS